MYGTDRHTLDGLRRTLFATRGWDVAAIYADALEESGELAHATFWRLALAGRLAPLVWVDRTGWLWFDWACFGPCGPPASGKALWKMAARWPLTDPFEDW